MQIGTALSAWDHTAASTTKSGTRQRSMLPQPAERRNPQTRQKAFPHLGPQEKAQSWSQQAKPGLQGKRTSCLMLQSQNHWLRPFEAVMTVTADLSTPFACTCDHLSFSSAMGMRQQ